MVAITRDLRFALFSLLSPFIGIGTWWESKRRNTQTQARATSASTSRSCRPSKSSVGEARRRSSARAARERSPDPAEVLRRAALPSMRLWERRPHARRLPRRCSPGSATSRGSRRSRRRAPQARRSRSRPRSRNRRAARRAGERRAGQGGVMGIVGDRAAALATARSLVCQAAVHHGPADLTIGVFVDEGREPDWEWAKWLPHTRSARRRRAVALGAARAQRGAAAAAWRTARAAARRCVVLDSDAAHRGPQRARPRAAERRPARAGRRAAATRAIPVAGIVVSSSARPAARGLQHRDRDRRAPTATRSRAAPTAGDAARSCSSRAWRRRAPARCARDARALRGPGARAGRAPGCRTACACCRCSSSTASTPDAIRRRWSGPARGPPAGPVGVTEQGVFALDLERDGPHGLVGGTTGSGKSELLRSLIAALAANADPRPADVPADGLQGRRGVRRLRAAAAHRRDGHRPRRGARRARAARARGRAAVPRAAAARRRRRQPAAPTTSATTRSRCHAWSW